MRWPMPRLALGLPERFSNPSHILIEKSSATNKGYRPFYCEYLFFAVGGDAFEEVLAWSFRIVQLC